jgi:hypothetical protein
MNEEPQLIDLFAMFAMDAQVKSAQYVADQYLREEIALRSYQMAQAMMEERKKYI